MSNPARSEEEITTCLMALVAWAGQTTPAARYLKAEKGISVKPTTLKEWMTARYADRFEKMRTEYGRQLEEKLSNDMREVAAFATEGAREAVEAARKRIRAGDEPDPARAAANLATVATKQTDKLLSLTGRPQVITESRNATEMLRGLIAEFPQVFQLSAEQPDMPAQIEEGPDA